MAVFRRPFAQPAGALSAGTPAATIPPPGSHLPPRSGSLDDDEDLHDARPALASLKTYIVEDSPVIRENLIATLEEMVPLQVVGTAEDEASATRWLLGPGHDADLVIIDIFLKSGSGLGLLQAARHVLRGSKLVVLSNYATPDMRRKCAELGADKVFDKSNEIDALISYCIRLAHGGGDSGNSAFSALA